ncbi:MAG: pyruvate, water dikinase regulatory protein [Neisseriaceae bacterium]|jgi:regulator of PEP synthase PpsR (kinase-PPPase family)
MKSVFFISDRTGITTEGLGNALLTQFESVIFRKEVIPFVDTLYKADQAIVKINNRYLQDGVKPIILTSIINPEIRNKFKLTNAFHMDFFESFIPNLELEIGAKASLAIGKSHGIIDENKYYKRIDAIDYSLYNDDGVTVRNFDEADVVLIGVSRVGKTPTCLYLAINYGIKAANYPFVENDLKNDRLPRALVPYHGKLFGLTIDVERLHHIRMNRLPNTEYSSMNTCLKEVNTAEHIMQTYDIPYLNTSKKSIEEISVAIMQSIHLHRKF